MTPRDPKDRLIVALDVDTLARAESLVDRLAGLVGHFKIGSQLFTASGPAAVEAIQKRGGRVFLDLKFHDIPNTAAGAAREAARMGVFMFTVHASGGRAMMRAAAEATAATAKELGGGRPLVLAVTVLTSLDRAALGRELGVASSVEGHVLHLCGQIAAIRRQFGPAWVIVAPGVRPTGAEAGDQSRTATPAAAARAGAHYVVVGRPITAAADPATAAHAILEEILFELRRGRGAAGDARDEARAGLK